MTWDKYSPHVRDELKHNPAINQAINKMFDDGHDKEYTQKITGAPYEVVDKLFNHRRKMKGGKTEIDPRSEE
jgi:hypothetical protein